jgi:aminopeptidase
MAVSQRIIKNCAKSMVEGCNLRRGDGVVVEGGAHTQELLEEIAFECFRRGATPTVVVSSDRYAERVYREIPKENFSIVPKQYVGLMKAADTLIFVEDFDDPSIGAKFPRDKLQARQKAMVPIYDVIYDTKDGKKWLYAGWATEKAAKSYGIPTSELEKIVFGGISVSPKTLAAFGTKAARKFKDADWVRVWDSKGTDFRVKVSGRRLNIDDGFISDHDYKANDRGCNLPAGELFMAPHEESGEGTLFCPVTRDRMTEKMIRDVHLEFKDGKLLLNKVQAANDVDALVASFKQSQQTDRKKYKPVRTLNVGELGIGYNPKIKKAIGYILTDEKVTGTVHVAFGSNNTYGGTSESVMHWDFVTAPGVNIEVETHGGRTVRVMSKGKFV